MKRDNVMRALFTLFGKCKNVNAQRVKACDIYKTNKEYKIITMYKTDIGVYHLDEPVFILPISSSKEELLNVIQKSISASRFINNPSKSSLKTFLHIIKEKNLNSFYKNSICCSIYVEGSDATIEPQNYSVKYKGLIPDKARTIILKNYKIEEVIDEVVRIL